MAGNISKGRVTKTYGKPRNSRRKRANSSDHTASTQDVDEAELLAIYGSGQKAKELKRAAAVPQSRTEKFREKIKATQQETIEGWKTHREEIMKSSREWAEELNAVFEKALTGDSLLENIRSMMPVTQEFTEGVEKLRDTISSALKSDLLLGEQWKDDGNEALEVLSKFTINEKATVAKYLEDDGEDGSGDSWMEAVRKSEKGIRKLLKAVPIPSDLE